MQQEGQSHDRVSFGPLQCIGRDQQAATGSTQDWPQRQPPLDSRSMKGALYVCLAPTLLVEGIRSRTQEQVNGYAPPKKFTSPSTCRWLGV